MHQRKLSHSDIEKTIFDPDRSFFTEKRDTKKFIKDIRGRNHQIVAKLLENKKDWLVLSVWVRGEEDRGFNIVEWVVLLPFKLVWRTVKFLMRK